MIAWGEMEFRSLEHDAWLSKQFWRPCFRVLDYQDAILTNELLGHLRGTRFGFYHVRIPAIRMPYLETYQQLGFHVVETLLVFDLSSVRTAVDDPYGVPRSRSSPFVTRAPLAVSSAHTEFFKETVIRPAVPEDAAHIADTNCYFPFNRFACDSHLPKSMTTRMKAEWIRTLLRGERGRTWVADHQGDLVGFLGVKDGPEDALGKVHTSHLDLVWVKVTGLGLGWALLKRWAREEDPHRTLLAGTQAINFPSLGFYVGCGGMLTEISYALHLHHSVRGKEEWRSMEKALYQERREDDAEGGTP